MTNKIELLPCPFCGALPCDQALSPSSAIVDVARERERQPTLGWSPEHDDAHDRDFALPRAAACYALAGTGGGNGPFWITHLQTPQQVWPYRWEWKPKDRRRNLIRAAALIVAEIERLDRGARRSNAGGDPYTGDTLTAALPGAKP